MLLLIVQLIIGNNDIIIAGILITGVTLITEMCENSPDTLMHFKKVNIIGICSNITHRRKRETRMHP